ncbi:hypothetical protein DFH09DRAFT_1077927 [Mycena vulgaris]|nr:hypothetical protein DFH09DRAFT_1077927 [Mycena vulgaris]
MGLRSWQEEVEHLVVEVKQLKDSFCDSEELANQPWGPLPPVSGKCIARRKKPSMTSSLRPVAQAAWPRGWSQATRCGRRSRSRDPESPPENNGRGHLFQRPAFPPHRSVASPVRKARHGERLLNSRGRGAPPSHHCRPRSHLRGLEGKEVLRQIGESTRALNVGRLVGGSCCNSSFVHLRGRRPPNSGCFDGAADRMSAHVRSAKVAFELKYGKPEHHARLMTGDCLIGRSD